MDFSFDAPEVEKVVAKERHRALLIWGTATPLRPSTLWGVVRG